MKLKLLFILILLPACGSIQQKENNICPPPPANFTQEDLLGTWAAGNTVDNDSDTLILRDDGKYKQIIHLKALSFDYASDWQDWQLLHNEENGLPYLYLKGMRLCAYGGGEIISCDVVGGGESEKSGYWYDFCSRKWVRMPGEGILIVLGTPKGFIAPPHGITLNLLRKGEDHWFYELQATSNK